jgi:hypothetical protein
LVGTYIDLFTRAAAQSRKPHYLLHSRPGVMDRALVAQLRERGIAVVGGLREGLLAIDRLARLASRALSRPNLFESQGTFSAALPDDPLLPQRPETRQRGR